MKRKVKVGHMSRKHLADPKLGVKYSCRLEQTKVQVRKGKFDVVDLGNGYSVLKKS